MAMTMAIAVSMMTRVAIAARNSGDHLNRDVDDNAKSNDSDSMAILMIMIAMLMGDHCFTITRVRAISRFLIAILLATNSIIITMVWAIIVL